MRRHIVVTLAECEGVAGQDLHEHILRIAARRGLDRTRTYLFWCPASDRDDACLLTQEVPEEGCV
jgi:hypothetical protein